jgi:hypothetical protein
VIEALSIGSYGELNALHRAGDLALANLLAIHEQ